MTPQQIFNWFEAALWITMSAPALFIGLRRATHAPKRAANRRLTLIASPTLIVFGATDIIEVYTGAWWSPWWLLVMKGACVAILAGCVIVLARLRAAK